MVKTWLLHHQPECLDGTEPISDGKTTKPGPEVKTCASETQQGFPSDHQILKLGNAGSCQKWVTDGHFPMKKWTIPRGFPMDFPWWM